MVAFPFTFKPAICNFEAKKLLWVTFPTVAASFLYQHAANTPVDKLPTEPEHLAQGETANISIALDDLLGRLKSRYTRLLQKEMSKVLEQIATTMMKKNKWPASWNLAKDCKWKTCEQNPPLSQLLSLGEGMPCAASLHWSL